MFVTENHKEKQFVHDIDYIPNNEASIIRSLKNLYDLNPQLILYKVNMKKNQNYYTYIYDFIYIYIICFIFFSQLGVDESISL